MNNRTWRPDLSDPGVQKRLAPRNAIYFNLISYCRHIGLRKLDDRNSTWVARIRRKDGGYTQNCLGHATQAGENLMSYEEAVECAERWFRRSDVRRIAAEPYQVGSKRTLSICPIGLEYSVGHALADYLDWKRIAGTKSHFETLVSLINYHLVPRISSIELETFNAKDFQDLAMAVIETPPKKGNRPPDPRGSIGDLSDDELRRRKKTLNALVSILRGAFDIAWEHDRLHSDRPKRCLRRVPNVDRPRVVFLDRQECRALLRACHVDLRPMVQAALYTGCRANELIQMRVADFDMKMNAVFVSSPKGHRSRHIFLPPEGVQFFRSLTKHRRSSDRMLRKANGRVWGGEYKSYFRKARAAADLPKELTFHGLRHTYASQLVQAGASLMVVADQLGHANTQTVSATYGHLVSAHREREVSAYFEPLIPGETSEGLSTTALANLDTRTAPVALPRFSSQETGCWPRSNFSKLSGPLLKKLRDHGD